MAAKRTDAVKLAKSSRWEELRRLVDAEPEVAQQVDAYGMLPLHWACTEPHSIGEGVLLTLLKAFPQGAKAANTAEMLPLQIAIKAQAKIEWLQALLASYPDAVLKKAPSGEHAVLLARKAGLPSRSIRLLEEMYHHVCAKEGVPDQLALDDAHQSQQGAAQTQAQDEAESQMRPSERFQAIAGDLPVPAEPSIGTQGRQRRLSSTASLKMRSFSDNDFYAHQLNASTGAMAPNLSLSATSTESLRATATSRTPFGNARGPARQAVSLPPRWQNAPQCSICAQKFGTFKKRHHCRNCGQSVCRDHSARERMKLPHYGLSDRHRVCVVCHDMLRNAQRQARQQQITQQMQRALPQPRIGQVATPMVAAGDTRRSDVRRSDEAQRSPAPATGAPLERHVSAPAGATMPYATNSVSSNGGDDVADQVASLQKQVSQLMEEKQQAEMQLRVQAEMLSDPERLTGLSRGSAASGGSGSHSRTSGSSGMPPQPRERQNSYPMKLRSTSNAATPGGNTAVYRSTGQLLNRTQSTGSFRAREVDIDSPSFGKGGLEPDLAGSRAVNANANADARPAAPAIKPRTTRLQDALSSLAVDDTTYDADADVDVESDSDSELDDRQTDVADFHDADAMADEYLVDDEIDDVDDDEALDDDDDDEEEAALAEKAKAATVTATVDAEEESGDEVGGDTLPEVDVLVSLGHLMMDKGSVSAAVQAFARAVEIRPTDPALHSLLGRAYYADENLDDAVASIARSLELEPSATNSTLLGKILFEKGDHEKAIEAYQRSLDMQN